MLCFMWWQKNHCLKRHKKIPPFAKRDWEFKILSGKFFFLSFYLTDD
jgi:hypothetical protein